MTKEISIPGEQPPMSEDLVIFEKIVNEAPNIMKRIEEKILEEQQEVAIKRFNVNVAEKVIPEPDPEI